MTPERDPEELRELLGAYALDALDPDERAQVDELLLADASARAELHELEHAAAWLGHASLRPPESAWQAIAARMDDDGAVVATPVAPEPQSSARALRRPQWAPRWLVAAAVVAVLLFGTAGVIALVGGGTSSRSPSAAFQAAEQNPKARTVILRSTDGRYSAPVAVLPDGIGYLSTAAMPTAAAGRDLQVWSITPEGPVSIGLVHGGDVHRFRVAPATTRLAVTSEPKGGSIAPTGNPIVSGALPAA
ncbi:MAG TPA: anti-sigma factor [Acidimicrobiia bacterium]